LPGLRLGEARLRNQVLEVVLQELLRTFDEDAQARMLGLSLYAGVALSPFVPNVVAMEPAAWAACQKRLGAAGVLSEERLEALTVPLLRVTLAWGRHLARRLVSPQRGAVETSYANSYVGLAGWLLQNETQNPQAVRVVARCEWPNLCRTLELLLAQDRLNLAHTFMQHLGHFCEGFGWVAVRDALSARVEAAAAQAIPAEGPLGRTGVQFLLGQGEQLLALGQVNEAGSLLQQLSERIGQEQGLAYSGDEAQFDQGLVAHQLGRCMRAGGRPDLALEAYERAHSFLGELLTDESVQRARLALSEDLGETLVATGQIDGAEVIYQQALSLAEGLGERGTLGALHEHLALIAIARQDAPRAATLLRDAITHFAAAEDLAHQASAWHHLGTVLWQQSEAAAAEQAFQQSLTLAQRTADAPLQAQLCLQLGQLAESAKRVRDAETYYARAQATCQQHGVPAALVAVEMAWAGLLLREGQLANARVHADAAYSALEQAGPGAARPWDVYTLLARIAEEEGDVPRAATWRARAQDAFAASSEAARVLAEWRAGIRGVARACRGETLEGDTVTMLETLDRDPSWQRLIAVIWRILDGERGAALYADLDYVDAAVARRILSEIEHPQWASDDEEVAAAEPTGEAQETSFSLEQLFTAVEAALRGDEQARQIVGAALQQMSQPDAPEPLPRLAQALLRIIQGERGAELAAGLPEELSAALETLLLRLT
jgi:tetratricopeptide (TPR) repeat protein